VISDECGVTLNEKWGDFEHPMRLQWILKIMKKTEDNWKCKVSQHSQHTK